EMRKQNDYYVIYSKYYKNRNAFRRRTESEYFSKNGSKISKYDDLIKEYAQELGWDWRILASLIYQESQFDPTAKSWAGAQGLMQLMPATAKQYGVEDVTNPYQNLRAGINYLKWLDNYWKEYVADQNERIKFVLASYNIGLGHIQDAMRLAEKYDGDPETWYDNVEKFLLSKSKKKYYNDPVVRNGYALGRETSKYVREIFERYEHYLQFIS
ncbi:MAG: transglycosylase SLT domain-containing protein, partial [Melioribacteraceae bacterium]|nr:transglycosylase SLT domain-containing protein [Melioribacteraceae bacterium]